MDLLIKFAFGFPLIYGTFSMTLYAFIAIVLLIDPPVNSTFYKLLVIGFVMNFFTYLNSFITCRIPQNTNFNGTFSDFFISHDRHQTDAWAPVHISHTLHYNFAFSQYLHSLMICLDRVLAIRFLLEWNKYRKTYVCLSIFIIFFVPLAFTHRILFGTSFYVYNEHGNFFYIESTYSRSEMYSILGPVLAVIANLSLMMVVIAVHELIKLNNERYSKLKTKMIKMAVCTLVIEMFLVVLSFFNWYIWVMSSVKENPVMAGWVFSLIPFASDALTLTPPFLILVFNETISAKCGEKIGYAMVRMGLPRYCFERMMRNIVGVAEVQRTGSIY